MPNDIRIGCTKSQKEGLLVLICFKEVALLGQAEFVEITGNEIWAAKAVVAMTVSTGS